MITEFYDVMLVDFGGILPFKLEKEEILSRQERVSQQKLDFFLVSLEKNMKESFVYVGSDLLETKLFHRIILKEGLLELLIGTPVTLLAHYKDAGKAKKFKQSLQKTLEKIVPEHVASLVEDSIEIKKIQKTLGNFQEGFKKLGKVS